MAEERKFTFGDDAPKESLSDDRLNYAPFAQRIAHAIAGLDAAGGYVIGLHGKWGSGKSTALNFVLEYLRQHHNAHRENRVIPIEFRPWLIAGHHDLIAAYFKVLSEALDGRTQSQGRLSRLWQRLKPEKTSDLVVAAIKLSLAMAEPTGTALVGRLAGAAASTANELSERIRKSPSLQKAYETLHDKLRESGQRYVVLIDDIDRLSADDIRSVMRMVKSVGQLPNVIYLLAYDREIVWRSFGRDAIRAEPSFVEKIVQQELQLPVASQSALLAMLDEELSFFPKDIENSLRWEHIKQDGVRRWIRSPRDVVRLSNAVKFCWAALEGAFDPQDLLAMEGLRLFDFEVFEWLRDQRDYLFTKRRFQLAEDDFKEQTAMSLQQTVSEEKWSQIRPLVIQLFPQMSRDLKDTFSVSGLDKDDAQKRRGIGSQAGFDSYFGLYPSPDAVPLAVVSRLVSGEADSDEIEACFREFLRRKNTLGDPLVEGLLHELLIRFRGVRPARPQPALLDALFAVGEEIISIDYSPGRTGNPVRVVADLLIREMLSRWGLDYAGPRLKKAFEESDSPGFLADIYVSRARELGAIEPTSTNQCPITGHDFDELGEVLIRKIKVSRNDGSLDRAPYYYNVARAWGHLETAEEPKTWLMNGVLESGTFLAKTCFGLVGTSTDVGGGRMFEMMREPDPEFYSVETLRDACAVHQNGAALGGEQQDMIAAVARGCQNILDSKRL